MPDKVIYYAVIDERSSRERPAGLFRRTYTEAGGLRDEAFTRDLVWKSSWTLVSAERGDLQYDFVEITADEATRLEGQLRARWTGPTGERSLSRASRGQVPGSVVAGSQVLR